MNVSIVEFCAEMTCIWGLIAIVFTFRWWFSRRNDSENLEFVIFCRNALDLFRGAGSQRFHDATGEQPLTSSDIILSSEDYKLFFTCDGDADKTEYKMIKTACLETDSGRRIEAANRALEINPDSAVAYILFSEEEAKTIVEAEQILKKAEKLNNANLRESGDTDDVYFCNKRIRVYIRRRLAMCARKLGKLKVASKMFYVQKDRSPILEVLHIEENLIEVLLAMKAYDLCEDLLSQYDETAPTTSATICYTNALLKVRVAINTSNHRAVEFNPHVPKYLLEMKSTILPIGHFIKRGDSEALAYSFNHLSHWKNVDGALNLLQDTCKETFRMLRHLLEHGR